jgi:hypothetical protein
VAITDADEHLVRRRRERALELFECNNRQVAEFRTVEIRVLHRAADRFDSFDVTQE